MAKMKAGLSSWKTFYLGILAGVYIAFGGTLAISLGGQMAGTKSTDPGLQKLVFGAFGLPFGLTMVIVCGAELVTGNFAVMSAG
jgi:formate/nitrite transporter FocA (FNT family)